MQDTDADRLATLARLFVTLETLAHNLPRAFDEVAKLHPDAAQALGFIALDIGKALTYPAALPVATKEAGNRLRLFALSLLNERAGRPLALPECPIAARVAQLESWLAERRAA